MKSIHKKDTTGFGITYSRNVNQNNKKKGYLTTYCSLMFSDLLNENIQFVKIVKCRDFNILLSD